VVARGMGKCCIAGCNDISVDLKNKILRVGTLEIHEGDFITLNGSTGEVILGEVAMVDPQLTDNFKRILDWATEVKRLKVRVNADTPLDAKVGREFGAEGIGLCRTEHMFFDDDRIKAVRKMILSVSEEGRRSALETILPMQQKDFEGIFREMDGLPVTIRLLDPPLHEFLPQKEEQTAELSEEMGIPVDKLKRIIDDLHESNPMLGHRGSRLGLTNPEIYEMQVRAIIQAGMAGSKDGVKGIS